MDDALYGAIAVPGWDDEFEDVRSRINLVCVASPDLGFRSLDETGLRDLLHFAFEKDRSLETINLKEELAAWQGDQRVRWLDEITPLNWMIGKKAYPIRYSPETDPREGVAYSPSVVVPADQLDDVDYHPFVCEGRMTVRIVLTDRQGRRLGETLDWPVYRSETGTGATRRS